MLPEKFLKWAYEDRAAMVRRMLAGETVDRRELFLSFTRHTPTFISYGPAGLNGSVKGVGFVPKPEHLDETVAAYLEHIRQGWRENYGQEGLALLVKHIWGEGCRERIDFSRLVSIELARKHSWENFQHNPQVTLCFYEPPAISFEVRGTVEIHTEGIYHQFGNAQHDVYHKPAPEAWHKRPVYVIRIEEIYDNSVGRGAFGTKIY